jgi:hypothetical protein
MKKFIFVLVLLVSTSRLSAQGVSTGANTNAGVITNTTITYTNESGTASRTGTFSGTVGWQAPATPVLGTWMPFQLQAGDRGVQSVQTVTLGTSYGAGSLSLILYRPLVTIPNPVANVGGIMAPTNMPGLRIWNNTCVWAIQMGPAGTSTIAGNYVLTAR